MKNYFRIIILIVLINATAMEAQKLKIVRTDVDTSRSGFVTAKYLFGIDIIGDSLFRCSAVSFSLRWSNEQYIKYSGWRPGSFGDSTATYVNTETGTGTGEGAIYVGITAAEPYKSEGYDNPYFIHFDFAVLSSSINNENTIFRFITLRANVNTDSGRVDIELTAEPVTYNIHSFIEIWPGDTDDNGLVSNDDILPIDKYFDFGSEVKKSRTFKRDNSSAIWKAQKVLAWDEIEATYADCDGNGVVNEADVLVLGVNAGRSRSGAGIIKQRPPTEKSGNDIIQMDNIVLIPVHYSIGEDVSGISGSIDLSNFNNNIRIQGIRKTDQDSEGKVFLGKLDKKENKAHFALITGSKNSYLDRKGILCYLEAETLNGTTPEDKPAISIQNIIDSWGYITPYSPSTEVTDEQTGTYKVSILSGVLTIESNNPEFPPCSYSIFDMAGRLVCNGANTTGNEVITLDISHLSKSNYLLVIDGIQYKIAL